MNRPSADTDYGFAVALNAFANLPFLGPGDTAWVSATYTDGAVGYINAGQAGPIGARPAATAISAGPLGLPFADAFVDPFTGDFKTNTAYGIAGGLNHNWNATWQTNVFGSWMRFDAPAVARFVVPATPATLAGRRRHGHGPRRLRRGSHREHTIWSPVTACSSASRFSYTRVDPGRVAVPTDVAGNARGSSSRPVRRMESRLRIQRDF